MSLCLTTSWDDGHPLDERLAELLDRHGCAATFYVPQSNREGLPVLGTPALRALDTRFEIGSHTLSHAYAGRMPAPAWAQQVVQGKAALQDLLGHAVQGFCYPGGQAGPAALAAVREAGFAYARSTVNLCLDAGTNRFCLPTTAQFYPHGRAVLARNWLRAGHWGSRWPAARVALGERDWQARLRRLLHLAAEQGGSFHLWGHSWEIDQLGLWDALDGLLREAAALAPPAQRLSNGQWAAQSFDTVAHV